ncbi:unnamed protein product [Gongylonema pulchrum]|uniref:Uncharacterized protein n=1 Tax=Gongylonema pulchrum TaxID=637853 RepID=A0A3P7Q1B8_9BILA|nr:unnamed protein product [Gongylonema pulchrum]
MQRCCALSVARKIYVGTDLVTLGSYYSGGLVDKKDLYSKEGPEFDFVSNIRTEQLLFFVITSLTNFGLFGCHFTEAHLIADTIYQQSVGTQTAGNNVQVEPRIPQGIAAPPAAYRPINPLQYRPPNLPQLQQRLAPPNGASYKAPSERLI